MKLIKYMSVILLALVTGCSTLILKPADFSWPVESVEKVAANGNVDIARYSISFNVKSLFFKETGDSLAYQDQKLSVIRNTEGYYFMVADNFKNVYVFTMHDGGFKLDNTIAITDTTRMQNPAFNQRPPYIQLVYGDKSVNLTQNGIKKEGDKK